MIKTVLRTMLLLMIACASTTYSSESVELDEEVDEQLILRAIEREEELWRLVREFVEDKKSLESITQKEYRRWNRLTKNKSPSEKETMERMYLELRNQATFDEPSLDQYSDIEEVVVVGSMFDDIEMDPATFSMADISQMRGIRMFANSTYRDGQYSEAYPALLQLAKRGYKDAQARLAYILFNGINEIEKSNLRALGWLGVAASGRTEPQFRVLFNRYMKQVPENVRPIVDQVVAAYRGAYAHQEHISCSTNHHWNEGVVKRTYCQFKLEAIEAACRQYECWANRVNTNE